MDTQGRSRAYDAAATADGQPAAPQALRATLLLAAVLTISMAQNLMADDAAQAAANRPARKARADASNAISIAETSEVWPDIRQPQYAMPSGEEVTEPEQRNVPAESTKKPSPRAERKVAADDAAKSAKKAESSWASSWRRIFSTDPEPAETVKAVKPATAASTDGRARPPAVPHPGERAARYASSDVLPVQVAGNEVGGNLAPSNEGSDPSQEVAAQSETGSRLAKFTETVVGMPGRSRVVTALGRQVTTMRSDEVLPGESVIVTAGAPESRVAAKRPAFDESPLLQPFKATNPAAAQSINGASVAYGRSSNQPPPNVLDSPQLGSLSGQLSMSTNDNWRTLADSVADDPILSEQGSANRSWTSIFPLMTDPFTVVENPEWAVQTAYQETLPAPPDQNGEDVFKDDAEQSNDDSEQRSGNDPKTLTGAEKVGEEPQDNTLQFLRTQTVLLEPGESQCDIGINYLYSENRFPILLLNSGAPVGADDVLFRIRELTFPLEYRVGLLERVQGFVGAPIGWSNTQVALGDYEQFQNDGGFGDLDFGTTIQVIDGNAECPHGLFTVVATAPTGGDPFGPAAILAQSAPSLGQGFWSISANALCIQTYDPIVLFYGVGAEHFFSRHFDNREIEPGNSWNYSFGVGFAVNDRVTLSTRFLGSYVEEVRVNRQRVLGTNVEPMTIRMAATISKPCDRIVEPFVEFGITESAVESFFGITWTY